MPNRVDNLIAAGRILDSLSHPEAVASVSVDGQRVDNLASAVFAYRFASRPDDETPPNIIDRSTEKLAGRIDSLREKLKGNKLGRTLLGWATRDPEKVSHTVDVQLTLTDGRRFHAPVQVGHRAETKWLQRISSVAEVVAMVPMVGYFVPPITAALAVAGSGIAALAGRMPLSRALMRTAAKHGLLGAAGLLPVLGTASAAVAAVVDQRDYQAARRSPSIAEIVRLGH